MRVSLSKYLNFCSGVKIAIDKVLQLMNEVSGEEVYMLGDIVHNSYVVKMLNDKGVRVAYDIEDIPDGRILVIRAHGTTPDVYRRAKEKKLKIIDATCNIVLKNQKIVSSMEKKGYTVVMIGDKSHDEVISIASFGKEPIIISSADEIKGLKDRLKKVCVIVQTTEIMENVKNILSELVLYVKEMNFINTVCRPSIIKQNEVVKLAKENEVIYIVGSKTSKNTKNLYYLAKKNNKNSFWIENKDMICSDDIKGVKSVAIAVGTSTPDFITNEIVEYLKGF